MNGGRPRSSRLASPRQWRERLFFYVRARVGLEGPLIDVCDDPAVAQTSPDSPTRVIHADLAVMLAGGLASLLTQSLHPVAMRVLAENSRYQDDPLGRLYNTARFLAITTFSTRDESRRAVEVVRRVHRAIASPAGDPAPYRADDPNLLAWIHAAETAMFARSWVRFSPHRAHPLDLDRYVAEMGEIGAALGVVDPPRTERELWRTLEEYRPILALSTDAAEARDFLLGAPAYTGRVRHWTFDRVAECAVSLLEPEHRELLGLDVPRITPVHRAVLGALRFAGARRP